MFDIYVNGVLVKEMMPTHAVIEFVRGRDMNTITIKDYWGKVVTLNSNWIPRGRF